MNSTAHLITDANSPGSVPLQFSVRFLLQFNSEQSHSLFHVAGVSFAAGIG